MYMEICSKFALYVISFVTSSVPVDVFVNMPKSHDTHRIQFRHTCTWKKPGIELDIPLPCIFTQPQHLTQKNEHGL